MASRMVQPERHQQLGEFLQQQQEPFVLENYLIERGYFRRSLSWKLQSSRFGCCNANSNKLIAIKGRIPNCSKLVKAILNKFGHGHETKNAKREANFSENETRGNGQEVAERERFSSASSTTVFNSCPESEKAESPSSIADTLEGLRLSNMTEDEAFAGGEFEFQFMASNKHSPVSVLEQFPLSSKFVFRKRQEQESETTCTVSLPSKTVAADDSNLSVSMCQLHFQPIPEKPRRIGGSGILDYDPMKLIEAEYDLPPQCAKSKRMLQETRQLLFDCVREIMEMESHAIGNGGKVKRRHKGLFGPEELGNLLLERIKAWDDKQVRNEPRIITSLRNLDIFETGQEWNSFEVEKIEICAQIGDSIAEEIMSEIIVETMNCHCEDLMFRKALS